MYADQYVNGSITESMVVLAELAKGQYRAIVSSHNNLATAFITKGLADVVNKHYAIAKTDDLDSLFNSFCGNCLIRNLSSDDITISNDPKKHVDQPHSTTMTIGRRAVQPDGQLSVFSFKQETQTFEAFLHVSRRKKEKARQYAMLQDLVLEMFGVEVCDSLGELLEMWPSADDMMRAGDHGAFLIKRQTFAGTRLQFTISREPREELPPLVKTS